VQLEKNQNNWVLNKRRYKIASGLQHFGMNVGKDKIKRCRKNIERRKTKIKCEKFIGRTFKIILKKT